MSRLRMLQVWMATAVLCMGLAVVPKVAAGGTQTFTGKVSDAMCGAKHSEGNIGISPPQTAFVPACKKALIMH
jgi:hypothetical protein